MFLVLKRYRNRAYVSHISESYPQINSSPPTRSPIFPSSALLYSVSSNEGFQKNSTSPGWTVMFVGLGSSDLLQHATASARSLSEASLVSGRIPGCRVLQPAYHVWIVRRMIVWQIPELASHHAMATRMNLNRAQVCITVTQSDSPRRNTLLPVMCAIPRTSRVPRSWEFQALCSFFGWSGTGRVAFCVRFLFQVPTHPPSGSLGQR